MSAHQVITGALNRGEHVYAIGSVEGVHFTACAVGADVVILASTLERVQIIPGCSGGTGGGGGAGGGGEDNHIVRSVACCSESGKIAATYGDQIRIFEPAVYAGEKAKHKLDYRWFETQSITVDAAVQSILWSFEGLRLLVVSNDKLVLYQHGSANSATKLEPKPQAPVTFCITDEDHSRHAAVCVWDIVWTARLSQSVRYIKYSPDGTFFATAGADDTVVKIWYQDGGDGDPSHEQLSFSFVQCYHPNPVVGLEWRRSGRYMPRRCTQNALMTWCEDSTSRIWKETPPPDLSAMDVSGEGIEPEWASRPASRKLFGKHIRVKKTRQKIMSKIKGMVSDKKRKSEDSISSGPAPIGLRAQFNKVPSYSELPSVYAGLVNVNFHLAATINAATDCLLVPNIDTRSLLSTKPFAVHWLNNKELVFSIGAEKLLAEAMLGEQESRKSLSVPDNHASSPCEDGDEGADGHQHHPVAESPVDIVSSPAGASVCSDSPSSKDILDVKLEMLLRQWARSGDVLFAIHPIDGSLLTWNVEWLDDAHRQPSVSFSARFPSALPLTDAASLTAQLASFNPHPPVYADLLARNGAESSLPDRVIEKRHSNAIYVLTNHENGSLNLWHLTMDDDSHFSTILSITHHARMCGHRFHINQVVAHPVLPLLLTTSQFANNDNADEHDALSEVILWKIAPVGPLCASGGVRELSRVASPSPCAFANLSWIPTILPSCTLGTVCNSPSSCFVATNGRDLIVYQAVVDARGLLAEMYSAKRSESPDHFDTYSNRSLSVSPQRRPSPLSETFNVVSTQSTAMPGCVLEIGKVVDALPEQCDVTLLQVFHERLVLVDEADDVDEGLEMDRSDETTFEDRFFVVMIEKGATHDSFVMFSLNLSSQAPQPIQQLDRELLPGDKGFLRPASPIPPSIARLSIESRWVCRQKLSLPDGVRVSSAVPAAGHLSSSSLYPACKAPYTLATSCDDDVVRFWKCGRDGGGYQWTEWRMVSDSRPSNCEVEGQIYSLSAAHSGRFACAYDSGSHYEGGKVEIGVFECESSGGVEWMREDTLTIDHLKPHAIESHPSVPESPRPTRDSLLLELSMRPSQRTESLLSRIGARPLGVNTALLSDEIRKAVAAQQEKSTHMLQKLQVEDMVRLDWVSTEDGSHILTVGVGAAIYLYSQISQDTAQQNIVMMKESESSLRRPSLRKASSLAAPSPSTNRLTRWVCTRVLRLQSADGLPPVPTTLTWTRDGLLIVGMHSEMRCYSQWNLEPAKPVKEVKDAPKELPRKTVMSVSASHSMLDQLGKKKDAGMKNKMIMDIIHKSTAKLHDEEPEDCSVIEALSSEGLFEAARFSSPILPQYHPKQLIVLLNAGRTRRVKAILLHILKCLTQLRVTMDNPLSRAASIRRMSTVDGPDAETIKPIDIDESPDYNEIDDIAPLALHALIAADSASAEAPRVEGGKGKSDYDGLFSSAPEEDLDDVLADGDSSSGGGRSRNPSGTSVCKEDGPAPVVFTERHRRKLAELLTHTHLPGLSSVDQMHLLAIADTLASFSADAMDKLTQANAAMQPVSQSVVTDSAAGGYATAAAGLETIDECGLRFLMAMKQHEFLLHCLPMKQRQQLRVSGLQNSHIIWAQHSDTESELLNAIPGMHRQNPSWEELKALGVAWWLRNTASLKICIEKLAKAAFQQEQDPMDASLYYLALKKKNVLTHLFKTSRNSVMAEFFMNDFNEQHWKKVAMKNAFVLMSKQRFAHAAAFFLLAGTLKDALQTIIVKMNDVQLAMVVLRLYETDPETQAQLLKEMLCREVLGESPEEFDENRGVCDDDSTLSHHASKDPFERSMAYWLLKDYSRAAHTLVVEAVASAEVSKASLSDIFNFYTFLRRHPLVVRQRLTDAGAQVGSTEKFLAVAKKLEGVVSPAERRLFFRTAAEHMAHGCPLLALDVLARLPKHVNMLPAGNDSLRALIQSEEEPGVMAASQSADKVESMDWSQPTNVVKEDELQLDWGDDDEEEVEEEEEGEKAKEKLEENGKEEQIVLPPAVESTSGVVDIIAQHLKFVASLRIMTEELSTLASGFEVNGGELRYQLLIWLEKEVDVLKELCDYHTELDSDAAADETLNTSALSNDVIVSTSPALHDAIRSDRAELNAKVRIAGKKRRWLVANQKLIRCFTSYCALHAAQNHRLTSALMELLLLLLEVQKDNGSQHLNETLPDMNSFPLLVSSVSSYKMFVSSPLSFIENQCHDLLSSLSDLATLPRPDNHFTKVYMLYNLCQGLSACLYQSLSDIDNLPTSYGATGVLTRRSRSHTGVDELKISTSPAKWPGVENLVALLGRERDDEGPQLRLLLAECFVAIFSCLFSFSLAASDSRWLYRLASHTMDPAAFGAVFGGGGEKVLKAIPPARPPRPSAPRIHKPSDASSTGTADSSPPQQQTDSTSLRAKLHARVFGADPAQPTAAAAASPTTPAAPPPHREHTVLKWVPPSKNVVQLYAERPSHSRADDEDWNSDVDNESRADSEFDDDSCYHAEPDSFAWLLMRLALVDQHMHRVRQFLMLTGYDPKEMASMAPRVDLVLRCLEGWRAQLINQIEHFAGGCPVDLLPNTTLDLTDQHTAPPLKKYRGLYDAGNTPFESEDPRVAPMKRLWAYLVRQEHLTPQFIRHIYAPTTKQGGMERYDALSGIDGSHLSEAYKIMQRDQEPIVAFTCCNDKPGMLAISTGRELQELDITALLEDSPWLDNQAALDVELTQQRRDPIKDNDDYQLIVDAPTGRSNNTNLMVKRTVGGIRRLDSHPTAPFYVSGSTDGSIRMWEWGVGNPVYTARVAGQHAKVTKIQFSASGSKFAAVDGDGMMCLWQVGQGAENKKPFFSVKAHSRTASDIRFLGHSASVLVTAGASTGDLNVALWDTLLPQKQAMVHAWTAHPEGATCCLYLPGQQTVVSAGAHGDLCLWDVRQRTLRSQVKAFEATQVVKTLVTDHTQDIIVTGNSDGDIKIWSADSNPQLMYVLGGEHAAKGGFSFRQVGTTVQGVQQCYVDSQMRLFSCGADASLKLRTIPSVYNLI